MSRVLIIGYGNPLRSDDGFGCRAAELLAQHFVDRSNIQVLSSQQLTPELADDLSCAETVIFLDASRDLSPGTFKLIELPANGAAVPALPYSHHVPPATLLQLCHDLWGKAPRAYLVTIGASHCGAGEKLSPELQRALGRVVDEVASLV